MTGFWFASYLVLWALVIVQSLLLVGVLRQMGMMTRQTDRVPAVAGSTFPSLQDDGPPIGAPISKEPYDTINGFGSLKPANSVGRGETLLVFLSPMCERCQYIVEPLNALVEDGSRAIQGMAIIRADEQACRAFQRVFPLHLPVVCDESRTITMGYDVHRIPFALLYDERGALVRKGLVETPEDLRALLGDTSAPESAWANVFPQVA